MARNTLPTSTKERSSEVDAFLSKIDRLAPTPREAGRGRLIFAMDATASRQPTWDHAMAIQAEMFTAAASVGALDVQLVYYRGFGECKASPFLPDAPSLLKSMASVACLGGQTQIGRVLTHAARTTVKNKVNAVVFIGDACEESADTLCHQAGELGLLGLPLFVFHEGGNPAVRQVFQQMARLSGGACCGFDGTSARQLAELLSAVAIFAAGGRKALTGWSAGRSADILLLTRQVTGG